MVSLEQLKLKLCALRDVPIINKYPIRATKEWSLFNISKSY
jgi:hypothetical protein